jgi:hypothetical protein
MPTNKGIRNRDPSDGLASVQIEVTPAHGGKRSGKSDIVSQLLTSTWFVREP